MPFEKMLANGALHARIEKEMPKSVPVTADEATFLAGSHVYQHHCALCHGLPNMDQGPIAKGTFPKPPQLFRGKGVTDDGPGETYWKVANGIRLTGMPSFKNSLSDTEMWQVSDPDRVVIKARVRAPFLKTWDRDRPRSRVSFSLRLPG